MKKGVIILISMLLAISIVYAQDITIPDVVENRLPIEFHAVSGSESITLDLVRYFGQEADFVVGETEHVNVTIDPVTKMATITATDPDWRGIETVVFATSPEYLAEEEVVQSDILPRRYRNLTRINVTADKIALVSDAFTQQQFNTIIGKLSGEQIDIVSFVSNTSLALAINDELTINFSTDEKTAAVPNIDFNFKLSEANRTLSFYEEKKDIWNFSFILIGLAVVIFLSIYIKYSWAGPLREVFLKSRPKQEVSKADIYRKDIKTNLRKLLNLVGKEKPKKLYRQGIHFGTQFLAKAYGIRSSNYDKKMDKKGINKGVQSKVKLFFTEYKDKLYTRTKIDDSDVKQLISFIKSMVRDL